MMYENGHGPVYDAGNWLVEHGPQIVQGAQDPGNLALYGLYALGAVGVAGGISKGVSLGYQNLQRIFTGRPGDIVLGRRRVTSMDWLLNPLVTLSFDDRTMHTQVIGPTGSGKTSLFLPVAIQDLLSGHSVFVLEIFGDFGTKLAPYAEALGVPTFVFDPSNPDSLRWNLFAGDSKEDTVERAAATMKAITEEEYYQSVNATLTRHMLSLAWDYAAQVGRRPDLQLFAMLLTDMTFLKEVLEITDTERKTRNWFEQRYLAWPERDRIKYSSGVEAHIDELLATEAARRALCPGEDEDTLSLKEALSFGGALTVIRVPVDAVKSEPARTIAYWALMTLQDVTLERGYMGQGARPLCCFLDEAHTLVGRGNKKAIESFGDWMTLVRKNRVAVTVAYQGYDLLPDLLAGILDTNGRNKIVAGGLKADDVRKAQREMGSEEQFLEDTRRTTGPNHRTSVSRGRRLGEKSRYTTDQIQRLRRGEWLALLLKNGNVQPPVKLRVPMAPSPERIARSLEAKAARRRRRAEEDAAGEAT